MNNIENDDFLEDAVTELFEAEPALIDESSFSFFDPPVYNVNPKESVSLGKVHEMIRSDLFASVTDAVQKDLDLKTKILPFVTFSGNFKTRSANEMISYSQMIVIDLDHLPSPFKTKEVLISDAFLNPVLAFISPSGTGLKLVLKIEEGMPEEHDLYFTAIASWLLRKYNLKVDKSGKDLARICFLCHDPNCYYSPTGSVNRIELLKLLPPLVPSPPIEDRSVTLPPAPQRPSDILNRMGEIFEKATSLLRQTGWQDKGELWYRPGRQLNEHHAAILNIDPKDGLYKFTNFSTQAQPFLCQGYTLVGIINEISYGGDFKACITELSKQYLPQNNNKFLMTEKTISNQAVLPDAYFQTRDFSQVMRDGLLSKPRRKIAGAFLYEDTNSYLFSRTNYGKSILAFQIGYCAATGTSINAHPALKNECPPMRVLIADLEMDARTLYDRHQRANQITNPELMKNLVYIHENHMVRPVFSLELLRKIEQSAIDNAAQLIIIDNISKLIPDLVKAEDVACVIETLKRIRQKIGASFLVIGHTIKSDSRTAITPQSYYGSAHLQNFFTEIFYLDATRDGKFFLSHSKTKQAECYEQTVPVFLRGSHPSIGVGFSFENLQPLSEVQLPLSFSAAISRKRNLSDYREEIAVLQKGGIKPKRIAEIFGVNRSSISRLLSGATP